MTCISDVLIRVEYYGRSVTLRELSERTGLQLHTLETRYHAGCRGANLWRPVHSRSQAEAAVDDRRKERLARQRDAIAKARAEHAAAFSAPLIDRALLTPAERAAICKRIKFARQPTELDALEAVG